MNIQNIETDEKAENIQSEQINPEELALEAESVLFACGEAVSFSRLAQAMQVSEEQIPFILSFLSDRYSNLKSSLQVLIMKDHAQLVTKSEYANIVRRALYIRRNQPLSKAALEVLAIVAFHQPTTRAFIDSVRGVESPSVVMSLCEKGLLEEKGRLDAPGKPLLYGTTPVFLRTFGIKNEEELKDMPEIQAFLEEHMRENQEIDLENSTEDNIENNITEDKTSENQSSIELNSSESAVNSISTNLTELQQKEQSEE